MLHHATPFLNSAAHNAFQAKPERFLARQQHVQGLAADRFQFSGADEKTDPVTPEAPQTQTPQPELAKTEPYKTKVLHHFADAIAAFPKLPAELTNKKARKVFTAFALRDAVPLVLGFSVPITGVFGLVVLLPIMGGISLLADSAAKRMVKDVKPDALNDTYFAKALFNFMQTQYSPPKDINGVAIDGSGAIAFAENLIDDLNNLNTGTYKQILGALKVLTQPLKKVLNLLPEKTRARIFTELEEHFPTHNPLPSKGLRFLLRIPLLKRAFREVDGHLGLSQGFKKVLNTIFGTTRKGQISRLAHWNLLDTFQKKGLRAAIGEGFSMLFQNGLAGVIHAAASKVGNPILRAPLTLAAWIAGLVVDDFLMRKIFLSHRQPAKA